MLHSAKCMLSNPKIMHAIYILTLMLSDHPLHLPGLIFFLFFPVEPPAP
jgi:hypothetical protein